MTRQTFRFRNQYMHLLEQATGIGGQDEFINATDEIVPDHLLVWRAMLYLWGLDQNGILARFLEENEGPVLTYGNMNLRKHFQGLVDRWTQTLNALTIRHYIKDGLKGRGLPAEPDRQAIDNAAAAIMAHDFPGYPGVTTLNAIAELRVQHLRLLKIRLRAQELFFRRQGRRPRLADMVYAARARYGDPVEVLLGRRTPYAYIFDRLKAEEVFMATELSPEGQYIDPGLPGNDPERLIRGPSINQGAVFTGGNLRSIDNWTWERVEGDIAGRMRDLIVRQPQLGARGYPRGGEANP